MSNQTETEGSIRFAYALEPPVGAVADPALLAALSGWREVFKRLGLLGQDPARYGGQGFGNVSGRDPQRPREFVITASQTGATPGLTDDDLVRITHSNPVRFWVDAVGHRPPSSETLTHAVIYQADPAVGWVFHVHCPDIWQRAAELALPLTAEDVPYGSPAMAEAVSQLLSQHQAGPAVFVTLGHQDGVFACGADADQAGGALLSLLARALV
jgi:ribulose-5-phosphate 4-epimerase/fuculose-1-phosphate aldolase